MVDKTWQGFGISHLTIGLTCRNGTNLRAPDVCQPPTIIASMRTRRMTRRTKSELLFKDVFSWLGLRIIRDVLSVLLRHFDVPHYLEIWLRERLLAFSESFDKASRHEVHKQRISRRLSPSTAERHGTLVWRSVDSNDVYSLPSNVHTSVSRHGSWAQGGCGDLFPCGRLPFALDCLGEEQSSAVHSSVHTPSRMLHD